MEPRVLFFFAFQSAFATTWPWLDGFLSSPREDAPVDGVLIYEGNAFPSAVLRYSDQEVELEVDYQTYEYGVVFPPEGGWPVGVPLAVELLEDNSIASEYGPWILNFESDGHLSGPPDTLASLVGEAGPVSSTTTYNREGTITVELVFAFDGEVDEWAGVRSMSKSDGASQPLSMMIGESSGVITEYQVPNEDGSVSPACFEVVPMSASGVYGDPLEVCPEPPAPVEEEPDSAASDSGCSAVGTTSSVWWLMLVVVGASRSGKPR